MPVCSRLTHYFNLGAQLFDIIASYDSHGQSIEGSETLGCGDAFEGDAHDLRPTEINTQQQFTEMHCRTEYPRVNVFNIVAGKHCDKTTVVGTVKKVIRHNDKVLGILEK